jgi:hypothetical protein
MYAYSHACAYMRVKEPPQERVSSAYTYQQIDKMRYMRVKEPPQGKHTARMQREGGGERERERTRTVKRV